MIFGPVATRQAAGCTLAHSTKLASRTLKKGHVLTQDDCTELLACGFDAIVVAQLEDGDLEEDSAAKRLAMAADAGGLQTDTAFTGRMNLYAEQSGVLVIDRDAVTRANRIDPGITFATLPEYEAVSAGRMVATAKIIPFAVSEASLAAAEKALRGAVRIAAYTPRKVGLVATCLPHLKTQTMDKTRRVLEERLRPSGSVIAGEKRVAHEEQAVVQAMQSLVADGADFLILFGASAVVDRKDVLPAALELAGGTVQHLGMPVDPGNLLMLGDLDAIPVLGAPGCARSPKENGFDWVLSRQLAGVPVSAEDITAMGVGGLLMEIGTRPQPRDTKQTRRMPRIAGILLGAGQSSRMGGPNKLLAELDGKPLLRYAAEAAVSARLEEIILVTGHMAEAVSETVSDLDVNVVHNPDFADGMAGSIRAGVNALSEDVDAVIILLGDMPKIDVTVLTALIDQYRAKETHLIVTATADGKRGNPVLWDRRFFDELKTLSGDIGGRHLIADNPGFTAEVEIGAAARLDLDTPEAIRKAGGSPPAQ